MSAAIPVSVIVSTVVVMSGTASRRATAFCIPIATASSAAMTSRTALVNGAFVVAATAHAVTTRTNSVAPPPPSSSARSRPQLADQRAADSGADQETGQRKY
jgi:hypothetical protein